MNKVERLQQVGWEWLIDLVVFAYLTMSIHLDIEWTLVDFWSVDDNTALR